MGLITRQLSEGLCQKAGFGQFLVIVHIATCSMSIWLPKISHYYGIRWPQLIRQNDTNCSLWVRPVRVLVIVASLLLTKILHTVVVQVNRASGMPYQSSLKTSPF